MSFESEKLFGTKLRALLQRRKYRNLFDLHEELRRLSLDPDKLITCFEYYPVLDGTPITRVNAEQRMLEKLRRSLTDDIASRYQAAMVAFIHVWRELIVRIKGDSWNLSDR